MFVFARNPEILVRQVLSPWWWDRCPGHQHVGLGRVLATVRGSGSLPVLLDSSADRWVCLGVQLVDAVADHICNIIGTGGFVLVQVSVMCLTSAARLALL